MTEPNEEKSKVTQAGENLAASVAAVEDDVATLLDEVVNDLENVLNRLKVAVAERQAKTEGGQ